jgi:DNA polymerase
LRFAITAPAGYSIVTADLSNIEARIVATLSGQTDLVEGFRRGEDIYARFAAQIYGTPVHKDTHPGERFIGKTCILGLGFGMGWKKFHLKMIQEGIIMSPEEAKRIVYLYRNTYAKIPGLWRDFDYAARKFMTDRQAMYPWRGLIFAHERIILPNGMPILYPGIRFTNSGGIGFRSRFAKESMADTAADGISAPAAHLNNVWGGAFTENVAQALARIILTRAELKLAKMGIVSVLNVHDELVWIIPTILVSRVKKVIAEVMTEQVDFLPDLPVAVEIHDGFTYGSAK